MLMRMFIGGLLLVLAGCKNANIEALPKVPTVMYKIEYSDFIIYLDILRPNILDDYYQDNSTNLVFAEGIDGVPDASLWGGRYFFSRMYTSPAGCVLVDLCKMMQAETFDSISQFNTELYNSIKRQNRKYNRESPDFNIPLTRTSLGSVIQLGDRKWCHYEGMGYTSDAQDTTDEVRDDFFYTPLTKGYYLRVQFWYDLGWKYNHYKDEIRQYAKDTVSKINIIVDQ